jgi:hypothetical protein
MSANTNQNNQQGTGAVSWGTKAGYIGTGVLIGLVIYPFVRKAISKIQPKMDKVFDDLTGKAEDFAERASDLMARAKENLAKGGHGEHDHAHVKVPGKPTVQ